MRWFSAGIALLVLQHAPAPLAAQSQTAVISLNPKITFQKMRGWEATAGAFLTTSPAFPLFKDQLFDLAVNDLGINRVRLEIRSGAENTRDFWSELQNKQITDQQFRCFRYATVNDNDDPFELNARGFHFSEFDSSIENVILPIKKRVEASGEKFFLNVNYVSFYLQMNDPSCPPGLRYLHDNPEEYAEFVLATYQHLKQKYGLVPDAWEIHLEPDNTPYWRGNTIGQAIVATAKRLEANGFTPSFIAPSPTDMSNAVPYFDEMIKIPGVLKYLAEFSYHRYRGVSDENLKQIGERAHRYQVNTSMLEHIGSGYEDLHKDLSVGRNSAWSQFGLAGLGVGSRKQIDDWSETKVVQLLIAAGKTGDPKVIADASKNAKSAIWNRFRYNGDSGGSYYTVDDSDPKNPRILMQNRTKWLRQYFKFVRSGAVRIESLSSVGALEPLAFINRGQRYVVVVKALDARSFAIKGLPAGAYGVKYTTENRYDMDAPDVVIQANQALTTSIPAAGVLTVYAKAAPAPAGN